MIETKIEIDEFRLCDRTEWRVEEAKKRIPQMRERERSEGKQKKAIMNGSEFLSFTYRTENKTKSNGHAHVRHDNDNRW